MNIVGTFVDAISGVATGVASTVTEVFNSIMMTEAGGLSNLAIWGLTFGAIGLVVGLCKLFTRKAG